MNNPWKDISLSDYENHMAMDSVQQLQAMNQMMKIPVCLGKVHQRFTKGALMVY